MKYPQVFQGVSGQRIMRRDDMKGGVQAVPQGRTTQDKRGIIIFPGIWVEGWCY